MVTRIAHTYIAPDLDNLLAAFNRYRDELHQRIAAELATSLFRRVESSAAKRATPPWWQRWRAGPKREPKHDREDAKSHADGGVIAAWRDRAQHAAHEEQVIYSSLAHVLGAIRTRHGRVLGECELLTALVAGRCANILGSERLGELIEPAVKQAVRGEGYRWLPAQAEPVIMNTKGASASGKSSQRQRQRALAARIGADWSDFALISPDIFRKYLLDYESLGPHYKYAGMLTGEELHIIDQKLDRYMAQKARRGRMSHLLIDRFRFDSFAPQSAERGSNLLTRFGSEVFLFFMVTAPHLTVERAWERGLRVGRFKSVDDLLYHNVEAFRGMPELFFTWALNDSKQVHYEFLDNDVARGETPRSIAFGANGTLRILQVSGLLNVERYRKINIDATSPAEVYPDPAQMAAERNLDFFRQCVARLAMVEFVEPSSGRIYLRVEHGQLVGSAPEVLQAALSGEHDGPALSAALAILGDPHAPNLQILNECVEQTAQHTLGAWTLP
jgi:hypothetical protein